MIHGSKRVSIHHVLHDTIMSRLKRAEVCTHRLHNCASHRYCTYKGDASKAYSTHLRNALQCCRNTNVAKNVTRNLLFRTTSAYFGLRFYREHKVCAYNRARKKAHSNLVHQTFYARHSSNCIDAIRHRTKYGRCACQLCTVLCTRIITHKFRA